MDKIQKTLDSAQALMQEAGQRIGSGLAGTRVLHALVTVLTRPMLTSDQQRQLDAILAAHEDCVRHNGEVKTPKPLAPSETKMRN